MHIYLIMVAVFACFSNQAFTQTSSQVLYKDLVFTEVTVTKNQSYRPGEPKTAKLKYALMDIYEAEDNNLASRPLIIWLHGGGFKYGNKRSAGIPGWSKSFAQRGYICAAINYRLSRKKPLRRFADLVDGCAEAIDDVHAVVSYFKRNFQQYRVDTNMIILAGNSAGGMIALHTVYSSTGELKKLSGNQDAVITGKTFNLSGIKAVINYWGAIFDSTWLERGAVPIVNVHGLRDRIVPIANKGPLNGSEVIYRRALALGTPAALKTYTGYGHELQKTFNPFWAGKRSKKRWLEAGQFAAGFLYTQVVGKGKVQELSPAGK